MKVRLCLREGDWKNWHMLITNARPLGWDCHLAFGHFDPVKRLREWIEGRERSEVRRKK